MRPISSPLKDLYNRNVKQNDEIILITAAVNGDTDSFNKLCRQYYPVMIAIAYSRLSDRDMAEDAAQEALFVAYRDLSKLKNINHFDRWLVGICRNIAVDMAKARTKDNHFTRDDFEPVSEDKGRRDDKIGVVKTIIAGLPARAKEIIYLRFYNQLSYPEIAKLLGISQQAVNGRIRRAKKIIAKQLNHQNYNEVDL